METTQLEDVMNIHSFNTDILFFSFILFLCTFYFSQVNLIYSIAFGWIHSRGRIRYAVQSLEMVCL